MNQKNWNERHFQICLALIARPVASVYGNNTPINFPDIINKADRMVTLLQEHEEKLLTNCDKNPPKDAK